MLSRQPHYVRSDPAFTSRAPQPADATRSTLALSEMRPRIPAVVESVANVGDDDVIATRLRELGFVPGEPVILLARGPFGGDPLLIQIGYTRFALRRSEAARVHVRTG